MTNENFDVIVEERIAKIRELLLAKRAEYAAGGRDRLHNFNRAAEMLRTTREKALLGMLTKHVVSILDIIDDFPKAIPSASMIDEKIGDFINYAILLEACIKEDIAKVHSSKAGPLEEKSKKTKTN